MTLVKDFLNFKSRPMKPFRNDYSLIQFRAADNKANRAVQSLYASCMLKAKSMATLHK